MRQGAPAVPPMIPDDLFAGSSSSSAAVPTAASLSGAASAPAPPSMPTLAPANTSGAVQYHSAVCGLSSRASALLGCELASRAMLLGAPDDGILDLGVRHGCDVMM